MSKAACRPAEDSILRQAGKWVYREGSDHYELTRQGSAVMFSVKEASRTLAAPVEWAVGNGEIGQNFSAEAAQYLH